jgi:CheY-like chemotaxis protein
MQNEKRRTILIAEDEDFNFALLREWLRQFNLNILHAKNGTEAIHACNSHPEIELILMDIKMPVMFGHLAALQIKEFRPKLPIIAQTAFALEQEIEKYGSVFDAYISKPIEEDDLLEKVKYFLEK